MMGPAAPRVERSTAEDTAARAPAIVLSQSMSSFGLGSTVIAVQYAYRQGTPIPLPVHQACGDTGQVVELRTVHTAELGADTLADARALLYAVFDDMTEEDWEHALGGVHA